MRQGQTSCRASMTFSIYLTCTSRVLHQYLGSTAQGQGCAAARLAVIGLVWKVHRQASELVGRHAGQGPAMRCEWWSTAVVLAETAGWALCLHARLLRMLLGFALLLRPASTAMQPPLDLAGRSALVPSAAAARSGEACFSGRSRPSQPARPHTACRTAAASVANGTELQSVGMGLHAAELPKLSGLSSGVMQRTAEFSQLERVSILSEALPYLQRFRGKTIVIKYGGAAMKDPTLKVGHTEHKGQLSSLADAELSALLQEGVIKDLVLLACVGIHPVFVHGGGPEINTWLDKLGIEHQFKNGLRVTDGALQSLWLLGHEQQH